ncbi:MAG TPA: hypothetical protein VIJ53_11030 [Acidobacteriaceae bacterium]
MTGYPFAYHGCGKVAARFAPNTTADDPALVSVLEKELAKG